VTPVRVTPSWLALREPADAAARATDLVEEIRRGLPVGRPLVIHDLACGTGATLRWLAPQLPGPQHWVNYDVDPDLLAELQDGPAVVAADGSTVTTQVQCRDVTDLDGADLEDAVLVTSSALLDLLCAEQLRRFVRGCVAARCPVLLTLTVTGVVHITPSHPVDELVAAAFNDHQRRAVAGGRLLGPDAAPAAVRLFADSGRDVVARPSPWQLQSTSRALASEWLRGWLASACEQDGGLAIHTEGYAERRLSDAAAGRLRIVVEHTDLLVRAQWP
jgi:SAM-dependent methyltransferase